MRPAESRDTTHMLAGDPHTHFFPIKKVQLREVFEQDALHFGKRRRRQVLAGPQVMVDLAENPRSSLGGPTDQQGIHPGLLDDFPGLFRRIDVAIGEHRYRHGLLDRRDGLVLRLPGVQVGAGPAMHRKSLDPRLFGELRDGDAVTVVPVPAGPDLQGDRYVDRPDHGIEDLGDQRLVPQQGGPRCLVAYLLRRAAHVDVDDLRTEFHIALRGLGQHGRIAAGDLHRARLVLAIVDQAQARLAAVPQADVAGHHLRYHHPGAKATAKLTERTIGHPGHRREDQSVGQCIWADAYHRHGASLSCGAAKKGRA